MPKLTTYKGYYRTERNGKRVGISFTYQLCPQTGAMINEHEYRVTEQN